jgi:hypothetical protein
MKFSVHNFLIIQQIIEFIQSSVCKKLAFNVLCNSPIMETFQILLCISVTWPSISMASLLHLAFSLQDISLLPVKRGTQIRKCKNVQQTLM